jgi:N6-L-threonylcarbamoyladenine synthase
VSSRSGVRVFGAVDPVPRVLGIETSCDETSAAIVEGEANDVRLASLVILSQDVHRIFGGVVPEIASRAHVTSIVAVVERAMSEAATSLDDIDVVGVTFAPGLIGALLVGVAYAKGLAWTLGIPLVSVHHMEGHLFAASLEEPDAVPPFTALLVSGGHTLLLDVPAWGTYRYLGGTRDDAAGEAFDKVAKLLGLPYPGGRPVEQLAATGNPERFRFPRPMLDRAQAESDPAYYDLSFSGLKTAVLHAVRDSPDLDRERADIARGFQDAVIDTLVEKAYRAARAFRRERIVLGGGVACNRTLLEAARSRGTASGVEVFAASPRLSADNGAMIARTALYRYECGETAGLDLTAYASRPLPGLIQMPAGA